METTYIFTGDRTRKSLPAIRRGSDKKIILNVAIKYTTDFLSNYSFLKNYGNRNNLVTKNHLQLPKALFKPQIIFKITI